MCPCGKAMRSGIPQRKCNRQPQVAVLCCTCLHLCGRCTHLGTTRRLRIPLQRSSRLDTGSTASNPKRNEEPIPQPYTPCRHTAPP